MISWSVVQRKRTYFGYPLYILVRNFSTALGYSLAALTILSRRSRGKEVAWDTLLDGSID
jgi:hypothetical protein